MENVYTRIAAIARTKPEVLGAKGDMVDSRMSRALNVPHRTFVNWCDTDFESIKRTDIDRLLTFLGCTYEDLFGKPKA